MKAKLIREVTYSGVGLDFRTTLPTILRLFQDTAAYHSELTGYGIETLRQRGIAWVLNKLGIVVWRYPHYGEVMEMESWSRGAAGFNMLRDFRVVVDSELVAAGSTNWFFYNASAGRIVRVPQEIVDGYAGEPHELAMNEGIERWRPYDQFQPELKSTVGIRATDLDPTAHVNNTNYCEYVLHAMDKHGLPVNRISEMRFQFSKEIGCDVSGIEVGLTPRANDRVLFKLCDAHTQYARGEIRLHKDAV